MNPVVNEVSGLQSELHKLPADVRGDSRVRRLEHLLASLATTSDVWGAGGVDRITEQTQALFGAVHELASATSVRNEEPGKFMEALDSLDQGTGRLLDLVLPFLMTRILGREAELQELQARLQRDLGANSTRQTQLAQAAKEQLGLLDQQATRARLAVDELVELGTKGLVAKRAGVFDDARKGHQTNAMLWTAVALSLATLTVAWVWHVGFGSVELPGNGWADPNAWRIAVSSTVVAAIGFSACVFAARLSSAHRHNAAVYAQKANSLASFLAFAETAGDNQMRLLLLTKLADSVFVGNDTAFRETTPTIEHPVSTTALETLKQFAPTKPVK